MNQENQSKPKSRDYKEILTKLKAKIEMDRAAGKPGEPVTLFGVTISSDIQLKFIEELLKDLETQEEGEEVPGKHLFGFEFDKVHYDSVTPNNKPTKKPGLSALLITPEGSEGKELSIICYQHGTEILRDYAPSKFYDNPGWLEERFVEVLIAGHIAIKNNCAVLMADYQGMGDDQKKEDPNYYVQPYMAAYPLARSVVDLLKHVRANLQSGGYKWKWNKKLYLIGYSQGGFVTMATARELRKDPNITITKCAPMAGPYSLSDVELEVLHKPFDWGYFLPMLIRGYYHTYDPGDPDGKYFTKEFAFKSLDPKTDCRVLWNEVVPYDNSQKSYDTLKVQADRLKLDINKFSVEPWILPPGPIHVRAALPCFLEAAEWFRQE